MTGSPTGCTRWILGRRFISRILVGHLSCCIVCLFQRVPCTQERRHVPGLQRAMRNFLCSIDLLPRAPTRLLVRTLPLSFTCGSVHVVRMDSPGFIRAVHEHPHGCLQALLAKLFGSCLGGLQRSRLCHVVVVRVFACLLLTTRALVSGGTVLRLRAGVVSRVPAVLLLVTSLLGVLPARIISSILPTVRLLLRPATILLAALVHGYRGCG